KPVREKKTVPNAVSCGVNPIRAYSRSWVSRNARPIRKVSVSPALRPARLPRLIDCSDQCIVKLDVTRMTVFTNATKTGRWNGGGGHAWGVTTRREQDDVKTERKSIT